MMVSLDRALFHVMKKVWVTINTVLAISSAGMMKRLKYKAKPSRAVTAKSYTPMMFEAVCRSKKVYSQLKNGELATSGSIPWASIRVNFMPPIQRYTIAIGAKLSHMMVLFSSFLSASK